MKHDQSLNGYLDRMRTNIHALDESIKDVCKVPRGEKPADKRARLKLLRDLVELQNQTLAAIKTHLLGRDETGAAVEPADKFEANNQVEFERLFKNQLSPWTIEDLKLECEDCHVKSEDVTYYSYEGEIDMYADLCDECYSKRTTSKLPEEGNENSTGKDSEPLFPELCNIDLSSPEKCEELIQRIKNLQAAGRLEARQAEVMIQAVNNAIEVHRILKKE